MILSELFEKITDTDDIPAFNVGSIGLEFENALLKGFELAGLAFTRNRGRGKGWDFIPKGKNWISDLEGKDVNIKVSKTKWLFSANEFVKVIDWDNFDIANASKQRTVIKKSLLKNKVQKLIFLRPKTTDIQNEITKIVKEEDIEQLKRILIKKNFAISKLGTGFKVDFKHKDNELKSVVVLSSNGKVFMRAERPRLIMGRSVIAFKRDNVLGKAKNPQKIVKKFESLLEKINKTLEG